jgi:protein-L-isoaspartate(D-aspartate) O-methyltransferase
MNSSEENFERLRKKMVEEQLLARGIKDRKVLDIFAKVPRHRFIDPALQMDAYGDFPVSIGRGQTISQPYIVALMVDLVRTDKVL